MKPGDRVFVKTKIQEIHPGSPIAGKYLIVLDRNQSEATNRTN